jgi:hypothetical protein
MDLGGAIFVILGTALLAWCWGYYRGYEKCRRRKR